MLHNNVVKMLLDHLDLTNHFQTKQVKKAVLLKIFGLIGIF